MKYFDFEEFEISSTAKRLKISNKLPDEYKPRIQELVDTILDPMREAWGSCITVSSGYRCLPLNTAVKSSNKSAHLHGYAADIVPGNGKIKEFKEFVMNWLKTNKVKFDQYINEKDGASEWVHIGLKNSAGEQRCQYLLYKDGKYFNL